MRLRAKRRHQWNLSFASMSDIAFLLIIFFAVAGKFTRSSEKDVVVPAVDLGEENQPRDIEMVVTKEGGYFVNGSRVERDALKDEITSYLVDDGTVESRTVVLYADRDAEYGHVAAAIEAVNQADAYLELAVRYAQ
ncbi:MAG: Biopolymer transport protein ExbD/TolR [Lentisphaerae bacterium ADurb.BinA184]|nr:MAG: Biopolymer transport protein ExbD/TolR [Lentisphaerae bacterium ADurb.BinA184]